MNETGEFSSILRLSEPAEELGAGFLLSVVEGPDRGLTLLVEPSLPSRAYVGTSASCEMRLADPEVSRRHVAVEAASGKLRVTDLGSASGTTANDVELVEAFVRGGELLRIGGTVIAVERHEAHEGAMPSRAERFGRIIGASAEMQRLYPLCQRHASTTFPVVIEGETGTGKELLAEALHEQGPRARGPFVVLDCRSSSAALTELERFAAACATTLDQAASGTLLVDEIGDLDLPLQADLLSALQRGGDVRALFTTTRDLDRLVELGRFREDLFDHVSIGRIELPPLRRRTGDVRRLALHFARDIGGPAATLPPELIAHWERGAWPGNVTALRCAVARWLALGDAPVESEGSLEDVLAQGLPLVQARDRLVAELERRYAERVLAEHGGDIASAAEASGLPRRRFRGSFILGG